MIITLEKAKEVNKDVTQEDLDGIEVAIRELTNNNFQNRHVRLSGNIVFAKDTIASHDEMIGFVHEKTIQVSDSKYNDGLYTIKEVVDQIITIDQDTLLPCSIREAFVTLVEYPADIVAGVKKLLAYDAKMGHKLGIKSETISRWTVSYYDQNASESVNGYPAAMMSFISKYRKVKWS